MYKFNNILKFFFFILVSHCFFLDSNNSVNDMREKYFLLDYNEKNINRNFGLKNNALRKNINPRGTEEYNQKGKKKKIGIQNKFFNFNDKLNNQNVYNASNQNDFFSNKTKSNLSPKLSDELSDEELEDFLNELFGE